MNATIRIILAAAGVLAIPPVSAVSFVTATTGDVNPPIVTDGPSVRSVPGGLMEITWTTNEAADSRVNYGDSPAALSRVAGDIEFTLSHRVRLAGLVPNTTYYYQVTTVDPAGNPTTTATLDFVAATPSYTLAVNKTGAGAGTVGGGGIYPVDTSVTPTATAAAGSSLAAWTPSSCATPFALGTDTTCVARFTLAADLNGDDIVDNSDYTVLRAAIGACTGAARYRAAADYDHDGCVTMADYRIWYTWYRNFLSAH